MSLHVASDKASVPSATFAKGEEPKTEEQGVGEDENVEQISAMDPSSMGLDGWAMSGWELVALSLRAIALGS